MRVTLKSQLLPSAIPATLLQPNPQKRLLTDPLNKDHIRFPQIKVRYRPQTAILCDPQEHKPKESRLQTDQELKVLKLSHQNTFISIWHYGM